MGVVGWDGLVKWLPDVWGWRMGFAGGGGAASWGWEQGWEQGWELGWELGWEHDGVSKGEDGPTGRLAACRGLPC